MFTESFYPARRLTQSYRPKLEELEPRLVPSTFQNFDRRGTPFVSTIAAAPPGPTVLREGPTGNFLRLATNVVPNNNAITFPRTRSGAARRVLVDFDFRMTPVIGRADGLGWALLNTRAFGPRGGVNPQPPFFVPEDPQFARSIGVGFDIYQSFDLGDVSNNHVSLHFDGRTVRQADLTRVMDLASGQWIHAQIEIRFLRRAALVSITLTPPGGQPSAVLEPIFVPGARAYEGRLWFGARSGGFSAWHDLENVRARFLKR